MESKSLNVRIGKGEIERILSLKADADYRQLRVMPINI